MFFSEIFFHFPSFLPYPLELSLYSRTILEPSPSHPRNGSCFERNHSLSPSVTLVVHFCPLPWYVLIGSRKVLVVWQQERLTESKNGYKDSSVHIWVDIVLTGEPRSFPNKSPLLPFELRIGFQKQIFIFLSGSNLIQFHPSVKCESSRRRTMAGAGSSVQRCPIHPWFRSIGSRIIKVSKPISVQVWYIHWMANPCPSFPSRIPTSNPTRVPRPTWWGHRLFAGSRRSVPRYQHRSDQVYQFLATSIPTPWQSVARSTRS